MSEDDSSIPIRQESVDRPDDRVVLDSIADFPRIEPRADLTELIESSGGLLPSRLAKQFELVDVQGEDPVVLFKSPAAGARDVSSGPRWRLLDVPWEYSGPDASADSHLRSRMEAWANAGSLAGAGKKPAEVSSLEWIGVGLTASNAVRLKARPVGWWNAHWSLHCQGWRTAYVGDPPAAHVQAQAQLQAYDGRGPVSGLAVSHLLNDSFASAPGVEMVTKRGEDGGGLVGLEVEFEIPAGATRWVNLLVRTRGYSDEDSFNRAGVDMMVTVHAPGLVVERV